MKKLILLTFISLQIFGSIDLGAQDLDSVSLNYNNRNLVDALSDLQTRYKLNIYYKKEWLKNKRVSASIEGVNIEKAFNRLLYGQKLTFIFRKPDHIILLPDDGNVIETITAEKSSNNKIVIGNIDFGAVTAILSGVIVNGENSMPLENAVVSVNNTNIRNVTDRNGFYQLELSPGEYDLKFHHPTMVDFDVTITLNSEGRLNVNMFEDVLRLSEVIINEEALDQNVSETVTGKEVISVETIKSIPAFFGEADVLSTVLSLPGVSKVGEGSSGLNVRGGGVGQNLIQIDNATIYNPTHLFGFFSAFNTDAIKKVNFYRGSIPAQFGGRLSSILDVEIKPGSKSEFSGNGGVGFINSRFSINGPIYKDTTSFMVAFRAAYPSYIIRQLEDQDLKNSSAFFGDTNLKIDHLFNSKNRLSVSGYLSRDRFNFTDDVLYDFGNKALGVDWNSQISENSFLQLTANHSRYNYLLEEKSDPQQASTLEAHVVESSVELQSDTEIKSHVLKYGVSLKRIEINPGTYSKDSEESIIEPIDIKREDGLEAALFLGDNFKLNSKISFYAGLRYSLFSGGRDGIEDSYSGVEPRLAINLQTSASSSVKLGYNKMRQYTHLISNTTAATPVDIWKITNAEITPSIADQISLGYFRNFKSNTLETSIEVYYKKTEALVEYINGADLFLNSNIENEILQGEGKAYGVELLLKKSRGDFNGFISYTYSRSLIQVIDSEPINTINNGEFFPTNFDQPHNLTVFSNIKVSRRFSINTNFIFNTGRAISYPESTYEVRGITIADFSERNKYRIPDYHRLDISFTLSTSLKRKKKVEANWSLSIYNLYGRKNAYSVYFKNDPITGDSEAYKLSVIGRPIIALSYNFKF
ncbi:MAG: TonB-dependent receptor [Fulvivirga sp.]